MMITIHGFPAKTKYQDVKILVKQECNINDFILDNLVNDQDGTKKVRIGLTDNSEGYRLMKCLDGYRMAGNFVLKAVPVGKAAATLSQPAPFETQPSYQNQPRSDYSNAPRNDYIRPTDYSDQGPHGGPHSHAAQVHGGPHSVAGPHSSGQHGVRASHIQSVPHGSGHQGGVDPMGRPSPWATASSNQNQWSSNAPVAAQVPQNTYSYNSTQAVNPGFGHQHQGHPRPEMRAGFNQGRGPDQGYGFPTKSNIPEGPANSRYRWTKIKKTEPELWNLPEEEEESSDHPSVDSSDDDEPPSKEALESLLAQDTSQNTGPDDPNDQKPMSKKERKKKENAWRNLSRLRAVDRRRLSWWLKRGKTFREARALCETHVKKCPEYAEARKFKLEKSRLKRLRQLAPEDQARFLRLKELLGPLGTAGHAIRLRVFDNFGEMSGEQVDMIYDKILELMEAENEENRPKLSSIRGRAGGINMNCADQKSIDWLKNSLKDLQLWEGAQLQVVNVNEMPKTIIGVAFVPDPNLHDVDIFEMLKSQNPFIDFSDWWITQAKMLPPNGQTVTFNISHNSIADLDAQNYNVFLGHKKIKIRIKSKYFPPGLGPIGGGPSTSTKKPHKGSVTQLRPPVKGKPPKQNKQNQKQGGPKQNNYHMQTGPFGKPSKKNRQQGESQGRSFGPSHQNQGRGRPENRQQGGPKPGKFKHTGPPGGFKPPNQNPQGPPGIQGKGKKKKSKGKKKPPQTSAQGDHNPDGLWNSWLDKNQSSVK